MRWQSVLGSPSVRVSDSGVCQTADIDSHTVCLSKGLTSHCPHESLHLSFCPYPSAVAVSTAGILSQSWQVCDRTGGHTPQIAADGWATFSRLNGLWLVLALYSSLPIWPQRNSIIPGLWLAVRGVGGLGRKEDGCQEAVMSGGGRDEEGNVPVTFIHTPWHTHGTLVRPHTWHSSQRPRIPTAMPTGYDKGLWTLTHWANFSPHW